MRKKISTIFGHFKPSGDVKSEILIIFASNSHLIPFSRIMNVSVEGNSCQPKYRVIRKPHGSLLPSCATSILRTPLRVICEPLGGHIANLCGKYIVSYVSGTSAGRVMYYRKPYSGYICSLCRQPKALPVIVEI